MNPKSKESDMHTMTTYQVRKEVSAGRMSADDGIKHLDDAESVEIRRHRILTVLWWVVVAAVFGVVLLASSAHAQPAGSAPSPGASLFQSLGIDHLLVLLAMAIVTWFFKNLEPHIKVWLSGQATDPTKSAGVHTVANIGLVVDQLVTSAAGHAVTDAQAAVAAGKDPADVYSVAAADLVSGLGDGSKNVAQQYFGTAGSAFVDFVEGLIKAKVQAAQAAGAQAASQVTTPAKAAAAIDAVPVKAS